MQCLNASFLNTVEQNRNKDQTFPIEDSRRYLSSMDSALSRLHFLANAIRKASAKRPEQDQLSFLSENDKLFRDVAVAYVKRECPDARPSLKEHVSNFIAERRRALLQRNRHAKKLKMRRRLNQTPSSKTEPPKVSSNEKFVKTRPPRAEVLRMPPSESGSKATRASKLDGRLALQQINRKPALSIRSSGSSRQQISESVMYPDPPKIAPGNKHVQCPYCLEPLPVSEMRKPPVNEYWK